MPPAATPSVSSSPQLSQRMTSENSSLSPEPGLGDKRKNRGGDTDHDENGRRVRHAPETPWKSWGRGICRCQDPQSNATLIVNTYWRVLSGQVTEHELPISAKRAYSSWKLIAAHNPGFAAAVASKDDAEFHRMLRNVEAGQKSARTTDTHEMKHAIIYMVAHLYPHDFDPSGLSPTDKTTRGFHHDILGGLICPCDMDWSDPKVKADLLAMPALASTASWPVFFYPKGQFDPADLSKGLLRGELLIMAYKYVFIGPSKWCLDLAVNPTKGGNAQIHNLSSVTARSIAYIASQVRFALSDGGSNHRRGGAFCMNKFFWHVVEYLEDPMFEEAVAELLQWWNEQIFPEHESPIAPVSSPKGSLEVMKEQALLRASALADRTNQTTGSEGSAAS